MPASPYLAVPFGAAPAPTQQTQNAIGGEIPWQPGGNPFAQDLGSAYQSAYNSALAQNQANYSNILKGYMQTLQGQQTAQQAIGSGYSQLYNNVLKGIQGVGKSQAQAIADAYAQQSGASQQDLINRGLGNSTVLSSVQRGLQADKTKADTALANQIAQLTAGYQSQLGGQGLAYAAQSAAANTAQQNRQLDWMNSVQSPYPDSRMYAALLQQQGMIDQANRDRALFQQQLEAQKQAANRAIGSAGAGGFGGVTRAGELPGLSGAISAGGSAGGLSSVTPYGLSSPNMTAPGDALPGFGAFSPSLGDPRSMGGLLPALGAAGGPAAPGGLGGWGASQPAPTVGTFGATYGPEAFAAGGDAGAGGDWGADDYSSGGDW